ncbi:MAG: M14 family metallopeptidase [Flavobacteriaceae bacterium]
MKKTLLFLLLITQGVIAQNHVDLSYYLPKDISYNPEIPTPESVLGHEVGEWHVTHDKLVSYMKVLSESSDRISYEERGQTYEGRPLILLTITDKNNHAKLEQIRLDHIGLVEKPVSKGDISEMPAVVYQGFSIHGNEPSGSNAALAVAYYLAAGEGPKIESLLKDLVILFDPSFNPDGLQRFAHWANSNRSTHINPDPNDREYHEEWPGGRTNHYYFDMNRDWLPVQLPESKARIASFHKWKPNVLTDHHEMGTNSSFFFQPGIPSRTHPLTPAMNQQLTREIGDFHAEALNGIGSLYYTEESFDDFYYGKGSTFPDINGGIGILFEQASSRGHAQESVNGVLTFPFTIRNQFTAALSTLAAAQTKREELLEYQNEFFSQAREEGSESKSKLLVFGSNKDKSKSAHLAQILERHQISIYKLKSELKTGSETYAIDDSYVVPMNQTNHRLIKAMFEKRTKFQDSLFYDVSAWTFPLAFDIDYTYLKSKDLLGSEIEKVSLPEGKLIGKSSYAYLMQWHEYYSPKALNQILKSGLRAKVGMKPFSVEGNNYDYGTVLIPVANQDMSAEKIEEFLAQVAKESHITITAVQTGLTSGIDLGSGNFRALKQPKVAMLVGGRVSSYDAGEIWHLLDTRYEIPVTKIDKNYFSRVDLSRYNTIILVSGSTLSTSDSQKLKTWVEQGGTLIGYRYALNYLKSQNFLKFDWIKSKSDTKNVSFEDRGDFRGAQVIGGAIFKAEQDRSHPLNFGYDNETISLFRNTTLFIKPSDKSAYINPLVYTKNPLQSGYISRENARVIGETLPLKIESFGRGRVIGFTDNTNFRGFWYGTNKLLMNSIFFSKMM